MGTYIGHTSEEGRQQLLIDHLKGGQPFGRTICQHI